MLQIASSPEQWHDWFESQGHYTVHSYYGPRFDSFEMVLSAARAGCGVALVPHFLARPELDEGKLIIPWNHRLASEGAYYMAIPEHKVGLESIRHFRDWVIERVMPSPPGQSA